jgi:hypothetical protein
MATNRVASMLTAAIACALGITACTEHPAAMPGMTYDSLTKLPDFSGWWYWDIPPDKFIAARTDAPLKPEAAAFLKDIAAKFVSGTLPDPVASGQKPRYCMPPRFAGFNGGFGDYVEFLFTPGRVTVADEGGLVRRIYLSDRPLPGGLDEMNSGTSVGHWEGRTLVVETAGFNSKTSFVGPFNLGHNVRLVERFSLKDPDTLEIATLMTAPDLFTAPYEKKYIYRRAHTHSFHEALSCVDDDRSVDPATGRQRFDLTPPAGIPPPPRD